MHVSQKLRFEDELVRHKILDLIGDLGLVGNMFLSATIKAVQPSHRQNSELLKALFGDFRNYEID